MEMDEIGTNVVQVVGRLSGDPRERTLPSGDLLVGLRLVVPRPDGAPGARVDTLEVSCWSARLRQRAARLRPGDVVRVEGALRRRFVRSAPGTSRYEIEATRLRIVSRASP